MRNTGPNALTRETVYYRDMGRCLRCARTLDAGGYSIHHRRPRGMGGSRDPHTNSPANLILLCGSGTTGCHGWVENHRAEAIELGYLIPQGQDPATHPVYVRTFLGNEWFTLTHTGGREIMEAQYAA